MSIYISPFFPLARFSRSFTECYGRDGNSPYDPYIRCWACLAVNTTIQGRTLDGRRDAVTITQRPTECALCSVNLVDEPLAMHPLYDDHGIKGRHIILTEQDNDDNPHNNNKNSPQQTNTSKRTAWCHSLCAQFICSYSQTRGCVYGCGATGTYGGDDDVELEEDDRSINSELAQAVMEDSNGNDEDDKEVHHFVIVLDTWRGKNTWTRAIQKAKRNHICCICEKDDDRPGVLSFAVQCSASVATGVAKQMKRARNQQEKQERCSAVMHVGCAIWDNRRNENTSNDNDNTTRTTIQRRKRRRQVFFFPGKPGTFESEPMANIYCAAHADDIAELEDKDQQQHQKKEPIAANDSEEEKTNSAYPLLNELQVEWSPQQRSPSSEDGMQHGWSPPPDDPPMFDTEDEEDELEDEMEEEDMEEDEETLSKRVQRSDLLVKASAENETNGELVVKMGSPIRCRESRDWSRLLVGQSYDEDFWERREWDFEEPVDPDDIYD